MRYVFVGILFASLIQFILWKTFQKIDSPVFLEKKLQSVSYTPYKDFEKNLSSPDEIKKDIELISKMSKKIRTYRVEEAEIVLKNLENMDNKTLMVDLGLWLGRDRDLNEKEVKEALRVLKKYYHKISTVIVGNEVLLRDDLQVDELNDLIKKIADKTRKPVTTAEVWHTWLKYPQLGESVDVIYVHILPYWEFVPHKNAMAFTIEQRNKIEELFSGKKITIGEFGWPSEGYNNGESVANLENQKMAIESFVKLADANKWNYNIVEAFDQPWKGKHEGSVGPYWGLIDAKREPKYPIAELEKDNEKPNHENYALPASIFLGIILAFFGLKNQRLNYGHSFTYALASQAMGFGIVMAAIYPFTHYMNFGNWVMWGMGTFLMIPLVVITLAKINELFKCTLGRPPERLVPLNLKSDRVPFVSIHVPAYKEQPHVLIETLESLAKLKYTNYEVLVVINNTPEDFYKQPIKECCQRLGEKFVYLDIVCTGFKAGALNEALKYTNKDAEILAVIDADYVIHPDWLVDLVPLFDDPKVAIVQAPQDHRDGSESLIKTAMNAEYAGFFDIGMVERNEENAIVAHGTMLMVRLLAMHEVGDWTTYTIVEDSELGLRLFEAGYTAHYTNRRYGWGLLPDTVEAFRNQRHRWAYGAIQILKRHWNHFTPSSKTLTPFQKYHFVAGWFFWLSDAFGAITSLLNIFWVPFILFVGVTIPTLPLTLPIITAFFVNVIHAFILYRTRVKMGFKETFLSAIASMSLQLVIFKAVYDGFIKEGLPFKRTEKGGNTKKKSANPIKNEMILAGLLSASFGALVLTNHSGITEVYVFATTLLVQSVPYYSAIILRIIELGSIKNQSKESKE